MQSLYQRESHARRYSDTDFFNKNNQAIEMMRHYHMLCDLMGKKNFYKTYVKYEEKALLSVLPVGLITADILDIESDYFDKLQAELAQQTEFHADKVKLDYLMNWWRLNYETLSTDIPFACQTIEPYFNSVLQEAEIWNLIENYLESAQTHPTLEDTKYYDHLLQSLAQLHHAFNEMFESQDANYFIKLIHSVRRAYAYWNIPIHPADQLVTLLQNYQHASQCIMDLAAKLQFLEVEPLLNPQACDQSVEKAIELNTQKLEEFQMARVHILEGIQDLDQFWRLKGHTVHEQCSDLPLNEAYEAQANTLFLKVSYWLLKRESRQKEHQGMPITIVEESMADAYDGVTDQISALIHTRLPLAISAPDMEQYVHNIYRSSFDCVEPELDSRFPGPHTA